jgi:hypothetical protein
LEHIHGIGHPVLSATGDLIQVLRTMVDITERKRTEEARDRLRQLEADLAHTNRGTRWERWPHLWRMKSSSPSPPPSPAPTAAWNCRRAAQNHGGSGVAAAGVHEPDAKRHRSHEGLRRRPYDEVAAAGVAGNVANAQSRGYLIGESLNK